MNLSYLYSTFIVFIVSLLNGALQINSQCVDVLSTAFCLRIADTNACHEDSNLYVTSCCKTCQQITSGSSVTITPASPTNLKPNGAPVAPSPSVPTSTNNAGAGRSEGPSSCKRDKLPAPFCQRMASTQNVCMDDSSFYAKSCCYTCSARSGSPSSRPAVNVVSPSRPAEPQPSRPITEVRPKPPPTSFQHTSIATSACGRRISGETFFQPGAPPLDAISGKDFQNKVFGGRTAERNSWPWMAILGNYEDSNLNWFCGGALISEKWIISAAHCLLERVDFVRLGEHVIGETDEEFPPEDFLVNISLWYPGYQSTQKYHDIALLQLHLTGPMNPRFRPVCLPWGGLSKSIIGEDVIVTGWGATAYLGARSNALREATIKIYETRRCASAYSKLSTQFRRGWPRGMDSTTVLCAGHPAGETDACQGDSGGPVVMGDHEKYMLLGIVSAGFGCGNKDYPGIYVPVFQSNYLQWIRETAFG